MSAGSRGVRIATLASVAFSMVMVDDFIYYTEQYDRPKKKGLAIRRPA